MSLSTISVTRKEVYGKTLYYPANAAARLALRLTGAKTLSHRELCLLGQLGHTIVKNCPATDFTAAGWEGVQV